MSVCRHISAWLPLEVSREILYWELLRKFVEKFQIGLKSDKNVGHFTLRPKVRFMVVGDNKFTIKHICAILNSFIFLTVTSISTVHTNALFRSHYKNSYANASQYFVIRILPSLADFLTFVPVMPTPT